MKDVVVLLGFFIGRYYFRGMGEFLFVFEECYIEGRRVEIDKLEDKDFEIKGIFMEGLGFVYF